MRADTEPYTLCFHLTRKVADLLRAFHLSLPGALFGKSKPGLFFQPLYVDNGNHKEYDYFMNSADLTKWRTERNLTQEQLADLLGVTKGCISRWEAGERHIPPFLQLALNCLKVKKGGATKGTNKGERKR